MKAIAIFFMCAFLICTFSEGQGKDCSPPPDAECPTFFSPGSTVYHKCSQYKCNADGSWTGLICPLMNCRNKIGQVGYDYSKPYPQCCPHPICGSNTSDE